MAFLTTAATFFVVLSILVFAHELGHFVTAKRAGIRVEEFGFGYPPRLFGIRLGETTYSINALPLGGFVKMLGENGTPGDPRAFASKSRTVRATVLSAGSLMNLALVPLLLSAALMVGEQVPCESCNRVQIYGVQAGMPGESAGLREGDVFVSIDGQAITSPEDVRRFVRSTSEREVVVVVERQGKPLTLRMTPRAVTQESQSSIGVQLGQEFVTVRYPIWQAVPMGFERTGILIRLVTDGLRRMVIGEIDAELSGPVGIARETGRAAEAGFAPLLQFTAFLSLNLAIFNMLPVPGLDGARLLFVIIEGVRGGRRINPKFEGAVHLVGMMLLLTLMLYVSFHDVRRLVPG
jgi:regulator of sigma E protease